MLAIVKRRLHKGRDGKAEKKNRRKEKERHGCVIGEQMSWRKYINKLLFGVLYCAGIDLATLINNFVADPGQGANPVEEHLNVMWFVSLNRGRPF